MAKFFVELNRSFLEIPKEHTFNEEEYDVSIAFGLLETKKWADLLKLHRVIILAEAGAGKTEEVWAVTKRLRNNSNKAFFLRLEHLGSDFEVSFEIGNNIEFNEWLVSDESGWFFLDSVDEARLCGPKQFEAAILKFGAKLGDSKQRAHIYITSRLSEWRAQSDLSFIKDKLPFIEFESTTNQKQGEVKLFQPNKSSIVANTPAAKSKRKPINPAVFALRPLDKIQIRTFSHALGIQDLDAFLTALQKAEAEIFSHRPQDLMELINCWKKLGQIANRARLIEDNISSKLSEADPDRAKVFPLTSEDARLGAEMLAAAVTFRKKNRILVPEQNTEVAIKTEAIDTQNVLKGWSNQIQTLLQRPIFDEAVYGTVRFHHRSVREYLTAKWLHRLLLNGKSRRAIEHLFFKERYGQQVLVPSMRPILAWLILFDDRIREKTAKVAPEIFIQGGDPSALSTDIRGHMLIKFCENYANQKAMDTSFDIYEVSRFAHRDLGETINLLLDKYSNHQEICDLLLRIIWQGEIKDCAEKAFNFALNAKNEVYTRIYGIRAVKAVGSENEKNKLVNALITDSTVKSEKLIGGIIAAFAPGILCIQDILTLIQRIEKSEKRPNALLLQSLREFFAHKCSNEDIIEWVHNFSPLLKQPPVIERRFFEVSQRYSRLLPFTVLAVERLVRIKHQNCFDTNVLEIISLAQGVRYFGYLHAEKHSLDELVPKWPELNRALFWFDVTLARRNLDKKKGERLIRFGQARTLDNYWQFTEKDFEKILEDISIKSDIDDRLVALSLAFQIYRINGRGRARRLLLKKAVHGVPELEKALHLYLHPPSMSDRERRFRRDENYFKNRQKQYEKKRADNRREWREWLQANTDILRDTSIAVDGKVWRDTNYLLYELRHKGDANDKWSESNWEDLILEFGQNVAEAYRDGCIDYWRKYHPKIRSEGIKNPNSIPGAIIVGLSGIEMENRQIPNWPRNLSVNEAKLACRYAVLEMNGFPNWLPKLHSVFPDIVEDGILAEIEWEFSQYADDTPCYYVLDDVVWQLDWLKTKISNQVLTFLKKYEPKHDDTVRKGLGIVLAEPELDKITLIEIAKTKVRAHTPCNRQALWLAAWMCVDAKGALEALSLILLKIAAPEQATELSMLFIVALFGKRRENFPNEYQDYLQPEILLCLIKLMHSYIRCAEDINRVGTGGYSPDLRDDAQYARDHLFQLLYDIPGKRTYLAMMDLAEHHPNEQLRQWYEPYAKRRAETDAEGEPWQPGDIACFAEEAERAPQNHRELYELGVSRLLDLKADLEDGDTSLAGILASVTDEKKHRNVIGNWLRDRSYGRYSVPQEEELADSKKPDIRIHGVGFDGPVPVELKIVDNNWTGAKLVERLNNQLCGQYLRDSRSNCGIFLLVYLGQKTYWKNPKTEEKLDFYKLVSFLEKEAKEIIAQNNKVESIEIIGIDLKKRITPRK